MKGYVVPLGRRVDTMFQRLLELGEIAIPPIGTDEIVHRVSIVLPCDDDLEGLAEGLEIAARALRAMAAADVARLESKVLEWAKTQTRTKEFSIRDVYAGVARPRGDLSTSAAAHRVLTRENGFAYFTKIMDHGLGGVSTPCWRLEP